MYRYTYIQNRHNNYIKKIRAAKLKKWCVYVSGKKKGGGGGGGGVELHIGLEI